MSAAASTRSASPALGVALAAGQRRNGHRFAILFLDLDRTQHTGSGTNATIETAVSTAAALAAHALAEALGTALGADLCERIGVHGIHLAAAGNGWQPPEGSDTEVPLSRRARCRVTTWTCRPTPRA